MRAKLCAANDASRGWGPRQLHCFCCCCFCSCSCCSSGANRISIPLHYLYKNKHSNLVPIGRVDTRQAATLHTYDNTTQTTALAFEKQVHMPKGISRNALIAAALPYISTVTSPAVVASTTRARLAATGARYSDSEPSGRGEDARATASFEIKRVAY